MSKFIVGDEVKIIEHTKKDFVGIEGEISEVKNTYGSVTQPGVGSLPIVNNYHVKTKGGEYILDVREEWLEKLN